MIFYVLFVFSILVSATTGEEIERETPAYKPTDVFLINCGALSNASDNTGQTWTTEQSNTFTSNPANASFSSNASERELIVPQVPYMTARIFRSSFTYIFTVSPGWKFLRLHFYPTRYGSDLDAVNSFFSVTVNGYTLLNDFNPVSSNVSFSYLIKEFIVPLLGGHNKTLNLTLTPSPHSLAFLNGVEIVSMPDRFYTKGGFDNNITDVGSNSEFKIDDKTVLETVYRLRMVGNMINGVNDTGMFRRWLSDENLIEKTDFVSPGSIVTVRTINYTEKTPAYVAPEDVYLTFRSMGNSKYPRQIPDFRMTWLFPVDVGFHYLVRLHFCETLTVATEPDKRLFSINIGNKVAKKKTDVLHLSGGPLNPMYLDFHIFLASHASKTGKRHNLRLDLRPYKNEISRDYSFSLNGIEILKLNDTKGNLSAGSNKNGRSHVLVVILITIGSTIGLTTFIVVLILSMRQMKRKKNSVVVFKIPLKQYTYTELTKITKSFSHIIGKGGFGIVYEGNLCNGVKVAVKVLKDLKGNGEDFINEVLSMSHTSHVNIVSLLGFCYQGSKRAIVYEFLENGSLDQFISRGTSSTRDVATLYGIALGIARGLEYLHYGCKTRIVHFDIKPQNILLDEKLCPKVSDFGLAKLCEKRESIMSLVDRRGTIGYIAPEVFSRTYGGVSYKSDVYSYGMLILEMMGARNKETSATYFPDWIYKDLENEEQTWICGDEITEEEKEIAKKMILVSLWCTQPSPLDRPPINKVIEMMEGRLDAIEVPPKPSMHTVIEHTDESSLLSDGGETSKK